MTKSRIGVYAGSFDPFTLGHLDIACRAAGCLDELVIAIGVNPAKNGFFTIEERMSLIQDMIDGHQNIRVATFQGLLVDFCQSIDAQIIVRGLRNSQDFEFEATLGRANKHLAPAIETLLLLSDPNAIFVSSSLMKEIVLNGGDVTGLVSQKTVDLFDVKMSRKGK